MRELVLTQKDLYTGHLILVNPQYAFHAPKHMDLTVLDERVPDVRLERSAAALLAELMQKINGHARIIPVSGWRSLKEQQKIWTDSMAQDGEAFTRQFVAVPGHSEHQTGLAIDLGLKKDKIDFICPDFPYDGICQTFRLHAADYGFVERYPKGKENITKIGHEPWHFRYVGIPHAHIMAENQFTLEEYTDFLKNYRYGVMPFCCRMHGQAFQISYVKADANGNAVLTLPEETAYTVSGNNADGFILTEWRKTNANAKSLRCNRSV